MGLMALLFIMLVIGITIQSHRVNATEQTLLKVVNPLTGDEWFNFTTLQKSVGDAFILNITITDVTNLGAWQVTLQWNPSLLTFVNITLPSDHAFHALNPITAGPDLSTPGQMTYGVSVGPGQPGFTGSGTLAQVALRIVQGGQCPISFEGVPTDTFLSALNLADIPFALVNGYYAYAQQQTYLNVINPLTGDQWFNFTKVGKNVGDTFMVNVTIVDVEELVCWQFGLQWNSSLLECVNTTIPSDNVFAYWNSTDEPLLVGGPDLSTPGLVVYGADIAWPGNVGFNGSGVLAQVEFKILQKGGQSELSFEGIIPGSGDTFLQHGIDLSDIPFVPTNAYYSYSDSGLLGDVNNDGTVDMKDVALVVLAFNSFPNTPRWNKSADVDSSGRVDTRDLVIVILNFKHG